MVVWISAQAPELTQAVRDWADFVHLRHIAAAGIPGFTQITAYENATEEHPRFMHFYELDTADPETICYQMMHPIVGHGSAVTTLRHLRSSRIGSLWDAGSSTRTRSTSLAKQSWMRDIRSKLLCRRVLKEPTMSSITFGASAISLQKVCVIAEHVRGARRYKRGH